MSIRIVKFESGRRLPMLVSTPVGLPDGRVVAYLLSKHKRSTPSTMTNKVLAIQEGLRFCQAAGISDLHKLCNGEFLHDGQLSRLATYLEGDGQAPKATAPAYYSGFVDFMGWLARTNSRDVGDSASCEGRIARFKERAKDHKPDPRRRVAPGRLGLTEAQRDEFLQGLLSLEHSPAPMSFRDFTIMYAAFQLGLRSGELLGLKVQDVERKNVEGKLRVVKRPADPDDPRREPAAQKTMARTLQMSAELTKAFDKLIASRSKVVAVRKHPYIFVNIAGGPLSLRGFRDIYQQFRCKYPNLNDLINHMLRHDWNDRWNEIVMEQGWDLDRAKRLQCKLMGWRDDSAMVDVYGRRSLQNEADQAALALQKTVFGKRRP